MIKKGLKIDIKVILESSKYRWNNNGGSAFLQKQCLEEYNEKVNERKREKDRKKMLISEIFF